MVNFDVVPIEEKCWFKHKKMMQYIQLDAPRIFWEINNSENPKEIKQKNI